jgi:hypothetical protein
MKQAAIAMGNSWKGVTSTLEDLIDINAAKAGEPLFRALKQELAGINDYLMSHQTEVAEWSQKVSDALIAGFGAVKDGIAFLVAHRELLLKLAEGWLALKVGGALGAGALGGAAGGAGGPGFAASLGLAFQGSSGAVARSQVQALKQAAPSIGQVIGGAMQGFMLSKFAGAEGWQADITAALGALGQLPGPIGAVSTALMGLKVGLDLLAKYVDENQQREIRSIETAESFSATFQRNQANVNDITSLLENRRALEQTLASGQFGEGQTGADYAAALATNRSAVSAAVIDEVTKARTEGLITPSAQFDVQKFHAMAAGFGWDPTKVALVTEDFTRAVEAMKIANPEFFKPKDKAEQVQQKKPAPVNVNIQRIEVSSRDPGRFVYGLAEIADKAVRAPTQARRARRGT